MQQIIYYSDEELTNAIKTATSLRSVMVSFGQHPSASAYASMKRNILRLGLDTSHLLGISSNKGKTLEPKLFNIEGYLVENSTYTCSSTMKNRLVRLGILEDRCNNCGLRTEWQGSPLVLQLDHINGVHSDYRKENLQILCPNCHSQTKTFCGKNKIRPNSVRDETSTRKQLPEWRKTKYLCSCGKPRYRNARLCRQCTAVNKEQAKWPSKEELLKLVWEKPTSTIAAELGVAPNSVARRCKKYGIQKPARGYWTKK